VVAICDFGGSEAMRNVRGDTRNKLCHEGEIKPIDCRIYLSMSMSGLICVALIIWDMSVDKF
jgi:hypothetical protein